jgi:hypothetical protein
MEAQFNDIILALSLDFEDQGGGKIYLSGAVEQ